MANPPEHCVYRCRVLDALDAATVRLDVAFSSMTREHAVRDGLSELWQDGAVWGQVTLRLWGLSGNEEQLRVGGPRHTKLCELLPPGTECILRTLCEPHDTTVWGGALWTTRNGSGPCINMQVLLEGQRGLAPV